MVRSRLRAGTQPAQIPPNCLRPLFQLPRLPGATLPLDLQPPKRFCRFPSSLQVMPQTKILKPLQHQQKSRPLPVRKTSKFRQILSPAPPRLPRLHCIHIEPIRASSNTIQPKSVQMNTLFERPTQATRIRPRGNPRDLAYHHLRPVISAVATHLQTPLPNSPDIHTRNADSPCLARVCAPNSAP